LFSNRVFVTQTRATMAAVLAMPSSYVALCHYE
jgi:hypothetical protein